MILKITISLNKMFNEIIWFNFYLLTTCMIPITNKDRWCFELFLCHIHTCYIITPESLCFQANNHVSPSLTSSHRVKLVKLSSSGLHQVKIKSRPGWHSWCSAGHQADTAPASSTQTFTFVSSKFQDVRQLSW